jgi:acyl-[acyl-carrier-protein]-phospholipid O-acyltransferase/long-chain-fatty-acid--[acyl-carrier-protein] ligase
MANLPLFHAFGLTVTQFMPLLEAVPMVCHADPTDALGSAKAIAQNRVTVLFGTSTFLRLYCRNHKIHPLMLESLRLVVAGAEKLQEEVRTAFNLKFNLPIYEGYGATETTPVASVNLPDKIDTHYWQVQAGNRPGSVGMPLPGSSCMIVDPVTFRELPTGEAGMILIGGAQVMVGYLNNPEKTASAIKEIQDMRWYVTGDKGVIDADGFLFIQDRYSRFAKIGGEMVSLTLVESALKKAINNDAIDVIVVAIEDAKKGERLIAITNAAVVKDEIRTEVLKQGLNALAIPGEWMQVEAMPLLGSGKTDFSLAKKMAKEWSDAGTVTVTETTD